MEINEITHIVIEEAIKVHKYTGPGLLERVYSEFPSYSLEKRGLRIQREVPIPVFFEEVKMDCGYRADIIVENKVLIEVKSVDSINDVFISQILTYLKFSKIRIGLLINFNVCFLRNGLKRLILTPH